MKKYTIPDEVQDGFDKIVSLDPSDIDLLSKIIDSLEIGEGFEKIPKKHKGKITSLDENGDFDDVLFSLYSLIDIFVDSQNSVEVFATDFSDSYREIETKEGDSNILKDYLIQLLPFFTKIKITAKARDLMIDNYRNYQGSRIISDIRIVFDDSNDLTNQQQSALIVHNLKLNYSRENNRKQKEFFISLDSSDLKDMLKQIERAIKKDESIRNKNHELKFIELS